MNQLIVHNFMQVFFGTYNLLGIIKCCGIQFTVDINLDGDISIKTTKGKRDSLLIAPFLDHFSEMRLRSLLQ